MKMIRSFLCFVLLLSMTSCGDNPLDLYPKTVLTEANLYKTEDQFIKAVNEVYYHIGVLYDGEGLVELTGLTQSDNTYIKRRAGGSTEIERIMNFRAGSNNDALASAWNSSYNGIYDANSVLEQLNNTDITFNRPEHKKRLISEVKVIRALIYFNLVRAWGKVPFLLKPVSPEESYSYLREEEDVIYQQIINDLVEAKQNIPESYSGDNIGRITKYGAAAILAKIYLRRGEIQKAKTELEAIIKSNLYSLDANRDGIVNKADYKYLFKATTKNSGSSILEAQYMAGQNAANSNHLHSQTPFLHSFHLPGIDVNNRGSGNNTPTEDLAKEFEVADSIRKKITINPGFVDLSTGEFVEYRWCMKFYDPNFRNPGQNFEIIRYADILLMYSKVTNDPTYLNKVRSRVGLPGYGEPGYPEKYNTLEEAITHERRVELAFEMKRFFDLVRNGKAVEVMQEKGYQNINKNKLIFPIPQHVTDVNPDIKQNPGYN